MIFFPDIGIAWQIPEDMKSSAPFWAAWTIQKQFSAYAKNEFEAKDIKKHVDTEKGVMADYLESLTNEVKVLKSMHQLRQKK